MTGNLLIYIAIERVRSAPLLFAGLVHTPTVNRRREFCHFADSPFPSILKRVREGRVGGRAAERQFRRWLHALSPHRKALMKRPHLIEHPAAGKVLMNLGGCIASPAFQAVVPDTVPIEQVCVCV